jgi:hypothetical protein
VPVRPNPAPTTFNAMYRTPARALDSAARYLILAYETTSFPVPAITR